MLWGPAPARMLVSIPTDVTVHSPLPSVLGHEPSTRGAAERDDHDHDHAAMSGQQSRAQHCMCS